MTHTQSKVPRISGSALYWKAFRLDLVARGLPDLSAHDGCQQVQATLCDGWGAVASDTDIEDLAAKVNNWSQLGGTQRCQYWQQRKGIDSLSSCSKVTMDSSDKFKNW